VDTNALIIEYSQNPLNKYIMEDATIRYREHNRICADVIEVFLKIENNILKDFSFDGYMSIVATACAAITGESLIGQDIRAILGYDDRYIQEIIGDGISPRRKNASLIGLLAAKNAIHEYLQDGKKEDFSDIMTL
jgi:nitrogen fixation protein NifU and related proteins